MLTFEHEYNVYVTIWTPIECLCYHLNTNWVFMLTC